MIDVRDEAEAARVVAMASYLCQVLVGLTRGPAEASGALLMALGMIGSQSKTGGPVRWSDPAFQSHARQVYEAGQKVMQR